MLLGPHNQRLGLPIVNEVDPYRVSSRGGFSHERKPETPRNYILLVVPERPRTGAGLTPLD